MTTTASGSRASLAQQVNALEVPDGQLAIWALGQHGFLLKGGKHVVVIDPYLSNYVSERSPEVQRRVPIAVAPGELDMVDTVLITHHHADHCDPRTLEPLLRASPRAQVFASYKARNELVDHGIDSARIAVPPIDRPFRLDDSLRITPIPAAHYGFEPDDDGNPAFLGFIVELNGVRLYHSGDTVVYEGQLERLQAQPIDVMCLPINGRDWFREQDKLVGNMDYREAAELAVRAGGPVLLTAHNDMFAGNRINPAYLFDYLETYHPELRAHQLRVGELYYYVAVSRGKP